MKVTHQRIAIVISFILAPLVLAAQEVKDCFLLKETMLSNLPWDKNRSLEITGSWKFKAGNPDGSPGSWASPGLDDRNWEKVSPGLPIDSLPKSGWNGIGWFRLRLLIDSGLMNKPITLNMIHPGASEVYVDGKLFTSFGRVGTTQHDEEGLNALTIIPPILIFTAPEHVIAIRYSGFYVLQNRPPTVTDLGFKLLVGNPAEVNKTILEHGNFFRPLEALVIAIPLTFALIHFILFLFYRREKSNLYFALFAGMFALWGLLEHEAIGNIDAALCLLLKRLWLPYLALMPVAGLRFLYSLFYKKPPVQFYIIFLTSVVTAICSWFTLIPVLSLLLFIVSLAEMIRVVIVAMRKKIPGAWIIGAGFATFCISLLLLILLTATGNFSLQLWYILLYLTGVLPILLSMSIYLSQKVALTNKNLETEMNRSVELQVENARKETELKKAAELKTAYQALEEAHADLKATQSQLIQSEKMASLGELTAGIAHEIQNPLNFVNNFSEVSNELVDEMNAELDKGDINEAKAIAADVKQNLEKINHHGKRADAIVKGMLQHSRGSSGQKEPTDINALCDEYLRLSYHGLRAKDKSFNADFRADLDPTIGKINIVPQDIGRVILNLINNAFYAVNEKQKTLNKKQETNNEKQETHYAPTVELSTKKEGSSILIQVKDNGTGIPQKVLDKIFQPFFTTKPTGQGTGLGLSLSYDIIKAHGGELKVETKEGEGTSFIIQIPTNQG